MARPFANREIPNTYEGLDALLSNLDRRKLGNNTYAVRLDPQSIGVQLHQTYVVILFDDGSVRLDSGGWHTNTTRDRINAFLPYPFALVQQKHTWYIDQIFNATNGEGRYRIRYGEFSDGMDLKPLQRDLCKADRA